MIAAPAAYSSPPFLHEMCSHIVRQLRNLGYPHADRTTCARILRAFFPHEPDLVEGSPDAYAAQAFLERLLEQCRARVRDSDIARGRRCYGQAVEEAITEVAARGEWAGHAPRLNELMMQLEADGHNTTQLRLELESLVDLVGMTRFYRD